MGVNTVKYIRKPLYVDAVRVTEENFDEIVAWCQGEVLTDDVPGQGTSRKYIKVRVHLPKNPRQTKAFVGDWILYTEKGYKVYTNKAFHASFDPAATGNDNGTVVENVELHSVSAVTANPDPTNGVGELVREPVHESIAEAVKEQVVESAEPMVSASPSAPPPQTEDGRRILTETEQAEMDADEIQSLLRSGEAVLQQDLV